MSTNSNGLPYTDGRDEPVLCTCPDVPAPRPLGPGYGPSHECAKCRRLLRVIP